MDKITVLYFAGLFLAAVTGFLVHIKNYGLAAYWALLLYIFMEICA